MIEGERHIAALIVDDQEDIRLLLRLIIEAANHGLRVAGEATDGTDALECIDALDPQVVVLDRMMPGMDGLECAALIRARRPDQVIVMCTAHVDEEMRTRALALGVSSVVSKKYMSRIADEIRAAVPA